MHALLLLPHKKPNWYWLKSSLLVFNYRSKQQVIFSYLIFAILLALINNNHTFTSLKKKALIPLLVAASQRDTEISKHFDTLENNGRKHHFLKFATGEKSLLIGGDSGDDGGGIPSSMFLQGNPSVLLSRGKPTKQKNEYRRTPKGPANLAVDGDKNPVFERGSETSCTHTDIKTPYPWWRVDLQMLAYIEKVQIVNRKDVNYSRLRNYYIYITETNDDIPEARQMKATDITCGGFHAGPEEKGKEIILGCNNKLGRYVTIYKYDDKSDEDNVLNLCEVEVYGWTNVCDANAKACSDYPNTECVSTDIKNFTCECIKGYEKNADNKCEPIKSDTAKNHSPAPTENKIVVKIVIE